MRLANRFIKPLAAIGTVTALAQPAMAMTCVEFSDLDMTEQQKVIDSMGGREQAREEARGDDPPVEPEGTVEIDPVDKDDTLAGREAAREAGRGAEVIVRVLNDCVKEPDGNLDDIISRTQ